MLQNILSFFDNLDNSQEYHKSIRDNLERVKNTLEEKIKICNNPRYPYEVQHFSSDIFDFVEIEIDAVDWQTEMAVVEIMIVQD